MVQLIDELTHLRKEVAQLKENRRDEGIANQEIAFIKEDVLEIKGEVRKLNHKILSDDIRRDSILLESFENSAKALEKHNFDKQDVVPVSNHCCKNNDNLKKLLNGSVILPEASPITKVISDNCSSRHSAASQLCPYWQQEIQDFGGDPSAPTYADVTASAIKEIRGIEGESASNAQKTVGPSTKKKSPVRGEKTKQDSISHNKRNQDVNTDEDGFQLVVNRKRKPVNIVGSKQTKDNETIKSAVRVADIYVGNCDLEATPETVSEYIHKEMDIVVQKCELLASKNQNSKSFKVTLKLNDRQKLLSSEVWPEGIICRKFYSPRN